MLPVFRRKAMICTLLMACTPVVSGILAECKLDEALAELWTAATSDGDAERGCAIDVQQALPDGTFVPYGTYAVTVRAATPSTFKLFSRDGQCQGGGEMAMREAIFEWRAPASDEAEVALGALCQQAGGAAVPLSAEVTLRAKDLPLKALAETATTTTDTTTTVWDERQHIPLRIGIAVVLVLVLFGLTQWGAETRYVSDTLASQSFDRREAEMAQSKVSGVL